MTAGSYENPSTKKKKKEDSSISEVQPKLQCQAGTLTQMIQ